MISVDKLTSIDNFDLKQDATEETAQKNTVFSTMFEQQFKAAEKSFDIKPVNQKNEDGKILPYPFLVTKEASSAETELTDLATKYTNSESNTPEKHINIVDLDLTNQDGSDSSVDNAVMSLLEQIELSNDIDLKMFATNDIKINFTSLHSEGTTDTDFLNEITKNLSPELLNKIQQITGSLTSTQAEQLVTQLKQLFSDTSVMASDVNTMEQTENTPALLVELKEKINEYKSLLVSDPSGSLKDNNLMRDLSELIELNDFSDISELSELDIAKLDLSKLINSTENIKQNIEKLDQLIHTAKFTNNTDPESLIKQAMLEQRPPQTTLPVEPITTKITPDVKKELDSLLSKLERHVQVKQVNSGETLPELEGDPILQTKSSSELYLDDLVVKEQAALSVQEKSAREVLLSSLKDNKTMVANTFDNFIKQITPKTEQVMQPQLLHTDMDVLPNITQAQTISNPAINKELLISQPINIANTDAAKSLQERVSFLLSQNKQEAEILLDPPELGSMQIKIRTEGEQAQVNFVVQNQQTKELLEQAMARLRELLSEQGMDLAESNIEQGSQESEKQETNDGQKSHSADENVEQITVRVAGDQLGGVDFYA